MLGEDMAINQTCYALVPNRDRINPYFLFYSIKILDDFFQQIAHGAIFNTVIGSSLRETEILLPPLPTQLRIADILSALDDKIELNRQTNATLEAMAQAIFKEWFVENEDAKEWKVKTLGEVVEFAYGKPLKEQERIMASVPVFGSNGQIGWHNEAIVKGPGIVIGRKGNPGIVTWAQADFFPIDTTFYVIPKTEIESMHYLFYALEQMGLSSLSADSAVPGLNRNIAYMSEIVIPDPKAIYTFDKIVEPMKEKILVNNEQSRTLAALRDALLPKLMNGEIEV